MKQPELGRKISELRTAKGFTQEELVEKCNISVRTIQITFSVIPVSREVGSRNLISPVIPAKAGILFLLSFLRRQESIALETRSLVKPGMTI